MRPEHVFILTLFGTLALLLTHAFRPRKTYQEVAADAADADTAGAATQSVAPTIVAARVNPARSSRTPPASAPIGRPSFTR